MVRVCWCEVCESGRRQEQVTGMHNRTTSSVTRNCTSVLRPSDAATLQDVTVCLWRHIVGRWRRRRNCSTSAASCGTRNASCRSSCVDVCNASQQRATGRLQELPSNLPPVSFLQVDVCHRGLMTTLEGHLPDTQAGFRPA